MRTLTTAILLTLCLCARGQTKKFYSESYYETECHSGTAFGLWNHAPTYNEIKASLKKWAYPHKITSFKVTLIQPATKANLATHGNKFECDKLFNEIFAVSGTSALAFASSRYFTTSYGITFQAYNGSDFKTALSISSPDSLGVYTVKFDKSKVTFLNDSTFTFKLK